MHIRLAASGDRQALAAMHVASIRELCAGHYEVGQIEAWTASITPEAYDQALREKIFLVAEEAGGIVGLGILDPDAACIDAVYVAPHAVRQGIGARLVACLEDQACRADCRCLTVYATLNAVGFYSLLGYALEGDAVHVLACGRTLPCVKMSRRFNPGAGEGRGGREPC
ncbi:MAG: GNAT family N-acetyltransferase [Desulfovibrionaceae bacterium]|nr:GNAT family N-acetyltransferase [Desulfovibrionaceae bacterium]